MSIVTVQLGQCGNQIGCDLFSLLHKDSHQSPQFTSTDAADNIAYKMDTLERYFTETRAGHHQHEAKAVMVDMEEKVVHSCRQTAARSGGNSFSRLFFSIIYPLTNYTISLLLERSL